MFELGIAAVLALIFLVLEEFLEIVYRLLCRHCKPFRRMMRRFFESLPMWWDEEA